MEKLPGVPMVQGIRAQFDAIARSQGKTLEQLEFEQKEAIASGQKRALSLSEDAAQFAGYNRMLLLRRYTFAPLRFVWNNSFGLLRNEWRWEQAATLGAGPGGSLVSLGALLSTLAEVHAHEIFFDGCFNGDPHPVSVFVNVAT